MGAHALLVEVEAGFGFAHERAALLKGEEVFEGLLINGAGIGVGVGWEADFGAVDVEKGIGFSLGEGGGFLAVDDVVGDAGHFGDACGVGAEALESFDSEHRGGKEKGIGWRLQEFVGGGKESPEGRS